MPFAIDVYGSDDLFHCLTLDTMLIEGFLENASLLNDGDFEHGLDLVA